MERKDHINKLRNKLNSQTVISDKDALWNELEPRLPKQKKNRKFIFWLPLAGLLFFASLIVINYISTEQTNQDTQITNETVTKTDLNKDLTAKINSGNNKKQELTSIANTTLKSTIPQPEKSTSNIKKNKTEDVTPSNYGSKKDLNNKTNTASTPTKNQTNLNEFLVKKDFTENTNKNKPASLITEKAKHSTPLQESFNKKIDIEESNYQNNKADKESSKIFLFPTLQKLGIDNMDTNNPTINVPNFVIQNTEEIINDNKWLVSFSTYALADWNFKSQTDLSPFGTQINNLTSIMPGYSNGGQLTVKSSKGLFFGLGLEQTRTFEKFKLDNSISSTQQVNNEEAFLFKGQFIANEQEILITTSQSVLSYNSYTKTNLLPSIGYAISRNFNYEIAVSPILNINQNYSGYLIDENQLITSDLDHLYNRDGIVLTGYSLRSSITKQFKNKFNLGLQLQFRSISNNVSDSNTDYNLDLKSLGLGLQLGYTFN